MAKTGLEEFLAMMRKRFQGMHAIAAGGDQGDVLLEIALLGHNNSKFCQRIHRRLTSHGGDPRDAVITETVQGESLAVLHKRLANLPTIAVPSDPVHTLLTIGMLPETAYGSGSGACLSSGAFCDSPARWLFAHQMLQRARRRAGRTVDGFLARRCACSTAVVLRLRSIRNGQRAAGSADGRCGHMVDPQKQHFP
ncbi:hypothetical protein ADT25_11495 [Xanthomonas oryzae]|uniref:Uncharacterized protein n=1 Tax=Xanthomonas oryzae TaxID=347 RepID=A0AAP0ZL05_9XANT|nr:hypothetical protein ADT25_11495 [Xanthomonas oryzae]QBG83039.1 hypothetical protein EYR27_02475 [Xanthomonas oryzae]